MGLVPSLAAADKGGVPHEGSNGKGAQRETPEPAVKPAPVQAAAPKPKAPRKAKKPKKPKKAPAPKQHSAGAAPSRPVAPPAPKPKQQPAVAKAPAKAKHGKTTICHHTGSATNPWVTITIADPALKAHRRHGDLIPAPAGGCPKPEQQDAAEVPLGLGASLPGPTTTVAPAEAAPVTAASSPITATSQSQPKGAVLGTTATSRSTARTRGSVRAVSAASRSSAPVAAEAAIETGGRMPYTGWPLWLVAMTGAAALLAGFALRRAHGTHN